MKYLFGVLLLVFSTANYADKFNLTFFGGLNFSTLKNEPLVNINNVVTNAYQTTEETNGNALWGGSIGHTFEDNIFKYYQFSLQVSGYSFDFGHINGIESPFINQGYFDTLNYRFHVRSSAALVEPMLTYNVYDFKPFLLVGIGAAWNHLSHYDEIPMDNSLSAAPATSLFGNNTKQSFAYEIGGGIARDFWKNKHYQLALRGAVSYRYFNLGQAKLGTFSAQTTSDRLQINNLDSQSMLFSLGISFN